LSSVFRVATLREDGGKQTNIEGSVIFYVAYGPSLVGIIISIPSLDYQI
jgi:hypothetical protein